MSYILSNSEQETIISFNESESTANISTFNGSLIRKLSELCKTRPTEITGKEPNEIGEAEFTVPKKWVKVNAGPTLSDEQRAQIRESAKRLHNRI